MTGNFLATLGEVLSDGLLALGLLGWQLDEGTLQARELLFRYHYNPTVKELFNPLCEAAVDSVGEELAKLPGGGIETALTSKTPRGAVLLLGASAGAGWWQTFRHSTFLDWRVDPRGQWL